MGFVIRLHDPAERRPRLIGRVPTASDALKLVREWRETNPEAWVEFVRPTTRRPSGNAA
jgi:hypothetical protein